MNKNQTTTLPTEIAQEALGHFTLSAMGSKDAQIAEELMERTYSSMDDLLKTVKPKIPGRYVGSFDSTVEALKNNPFFALYFEA